MLTPYKLLETLGYKIVQAVFNEFPQAEAVTILIKKKQPPIGAICDYAAVELTLNREELI
jgi:dihydroneopterin aldolase